MRRDCVQHEAVTIGRQRDEDRIGIVDEIFRTLGNGRKEGAFDGALGREAPSLCECHSAGAGRRPERCLVSQFFKKCSGAKGNRASTCDTYAHVVFHFH